MKEKRLAKRQPFSRERGIFMLTMKSKLLVEVQQS